MASLDALLRLRSDFFWGRILQLLEEDLVGVWVSDLRLGDFCVCLYVYFFCVCVCFFYSLFLFSNIFFTILLLIFGG